MKTTIRILVALQALSLSLNATQPKRDEAGAAQIVNSYCMLDAEGTRLNSQTYGKIMALVTWEAEPGWDTAVVISEYKVGSAAKQGNDTIVPVTFRRIGTLDGDTFISKRGTELIRFRVLTRNGKYKIAGPKLSPHVTIAKMMEHVKRLIDEEEDQSRKSQLIKVLEELKKQR